MIFEEIDGSLLKLIRLVGKSQKRMEILEFLEKEKATTARILQDKVAMKSRAVYNFLQELASVGYVRFEKKQNATRYVSIIILNYKNGFNVDYEKILEEHNALVRAEKELMKAKFPIMIIANLEFKITKDIPLTLRCNNLSITVPDEATRTPAGLEEYVVAQLNKHFPNKKRKTVYSKISAEENAQFEKEHAAYKARVAARKKAMEESN